MKVKDAYQELFKYFVGSITSDLLFESLEKSMDTFKYVVAYHSADEFLQRNMGRQLLRPYHKSVLIHGKNFMDPDKDTFINEANESIYLSDEKKNEMINTLSEAWDVIVPQYKSWGESKQPFGEDEEIVIEPPIPSRIINNP
jgi:hypothetical protein